MFSEVEVKLEEEPKVQRKSGGILRPSEGMNEVLTAAFLAKGADLQKANNELQKWRDAETISKHDAEKQSWAVEKEELVKRLRVAEQINHSKSQSGAVNTEEVVPHKAHI